MAIRSPFNHATPLSSEGQPLKPALPVAALSIFQANQSLATAIEPDAPVFSVEEIDKAKEESLVTQTESITQRTRKPSGLMTLRVESLGSYDKSSQAITATMQSVGHAGFGSAVAQAQGYIYATGVVTAPCEATLDADNEVAVAGAAMLTTFEGPLTVTAPAVATLETSFYSLVDFRWAEDQSPAIWNPSGVTTMQIKTGAFKYALAIRVRLSKGATLLGNDWFLSYSTDGKTWIECQNFGSDVSIGGAFDNLPLPSVVSPDPFFEFSSVNFVTSPGPGSPALATGRLVLNDFEQSPRVSLAVPEITELETWTCLSFDPSLAGEDIYFRIDSANLSSFGTGVRVFSAAMAGPWATNLI